jgi:glycosyltransferase involved in cell wall biosynthesis
MKTWISTQIGAREYYAIPRMLARAGCLSALYTDLWLPWSQRLPLIGRTKRLRARYAPGLSSAIIRSRNVRALLRSITRKDDRYTEWMSEGRRFALWVASSLRNERVGLEHAIFGYTCANLELLQFATQRGAFAVHGQIDPGPVWYRTRREELSRWPDAELDSADPPAAFIDRVLAECEVADRIIVNSNYSRASLMSEGVSAAKICIVPLCYEPTASASVDVRTAPAPAAFRVLFVGNVTLAKGFPYFAEAARLLGSGFEFRAVGAVGLTAAFIRKNRQWPVTYLGHVDRERLATEYSTAHALVFPTLSDGFGMVQLEAQARGKPVIATANCGEVVVDGVSGYIVPPRDATAIADHVQRLRDDPQCWHEMSAAALVNSRRFSFENVSQSLVQALGVNG